MKLYVTFGQCHVHETDGKCFDKDCIAVIECRDYAEGRNLAFEYFGGEFFTTYTREHILPAMQYYPRGFIEVN